MPQTYPRLQSSPPAPSPQLSPLSEPRQAPPIPSPMATTPPPDLPPPAQHPQLPPPAPSGPPALVALQGSLRNPLPVILSALGLVLIGAALFFPLASYVWGGESDENPIGPGDGDQLMLDLSGEPAIVFLTLAVAVTIAMAASPRWLLFGRLASIGLAALAAVSALSTARNWIDDVDDRLTAFASQNTEDAELDLELTSRLRDQLNDADVGADTGLWLLLAGLALLAAATIVIRTRVTVPPFGATRTVGYPPVYPAPTTAPPAPPAPAASGADEGDDRALLVHDDPPSLSIYKRPKT